MHTVKHTVPPPFVNTCLIYLSGIEQVCGTQKIVLRDPFFLPPYEFWTSNSSCQAWQQVVQPSYQSSLCLINSWFIIKGFGVPMFLSDIWVSQTLCSWLALGFGVSQSGEVCRWKARLLWFDICLPSAAESPWRAFFLPGEPPSFNLPSENCFISLLGTFMMVMSGGWRPQCKAQRVSLPAVWRRILESFPL